MKRRLPFLALWLLLGSGPLAAQAPDLASSYYHYSLATLHELREEYSQAITEFEKAVLLDAESASLRVDFAATLWKAGQVDRAVEECEMASQMDRQDPAPHFLLARIYTNQGNRGRPELLDKAVAELRTTVELDPEHREALFDLGRLLLFSQRDYPGAINALGRLIELMPWVVQAYELQAKAHVELGQDEEAIAVLEKAREYEGQNVEVLRLLGSLYEKTGRTMEARTLYAEAVDRHSDPGLLFSYAALLVQQEDFAQGIPLLQQLVRSYPDNTRYNLTLVQALRGYKKYGEAARILEGLLESSPGHYGLNYELAETLALLGERERSEEIFLDLRSRSDSDDQRQAVETNLALLYQQGGRLGEAVSLLRKLRQENPEDVFTGLRLVYALRDAGEFGEALSVADALIALRQGREPDTPPRAEYLIIARAQVLSSLDRTEAAIRLLRENLDESSEPINLYLTASVIFSEHGRFEEAEAIIREALERHPANERLEFQLGAIYEQQGMLEGVEEVFDGILGRNPGHAGVLNYLGYMLADRGIRLREALEYIQKAVDIEPHNGAFLDSLGWVYFKLEEVEKAERHLLQAARLSGSDATIYDHLGDLYRRLKRYDLARDYYRKSVQFAEKEELERVGKKLAELESLLSDKDR